MNARVAILLLLCLVGCATSRSNRAEAEAFLVVTFTAVDEFLRLEDQLAEAPEEIRQAADWLREEYPGWWAEGVRLLQQWRRDTKRPVAWEWVQRRLAEMAQVATALREELEEQPWTR